MPLQQVGALRALVAVAVLVSSAVHLSVYVEGFAAIPVIGPLFLATVIGGVVIAAAVTFSRHWIVALLAVGFGLTTVVAYWISVVHGLFGVREVAGGWPEIVAETAEYAAVIIGAMAATILWRQRNPNRPGIAARGKTSMAIGRPFTTSPPGPARGLVLPGRTGP